MEIVSTDKAPAAIGPYSQAIAAGGFVFCSGQIPINPETGQLVEGGVEEATKQVLANLEEVLTAAGADKTDVVKTTIFLNDMNDFGVVNGIYGDFFGDHKPARATVEVARLPKDVAVEIDCVAFVG
ncbi:MAG: RidA family protein [Candidatus Peregrinibacteria bacterium]|nr:RidA family protein [Candidatus Peregrinibacteria bacterium]